MTYSLCRRISQFMALGLMFLIPVLNSYEIYSVTGTFYAVNFGGLGIADPAVILQAIFSAGETSKVLLTAVLIPVIGVVLFGRVWCGWLCPFLLLAEGVDAMRKILGRRRLRWLFRSKVPVPDALSANVVRYGFLIAGTALAGVMGVPLLNYVHTPGILSTEAMLVVRERVVSVEFALIVIILGFQLTIFPKMWCRLFCPTGSVSALFKTSTGLRVVCLSRQTTGSCCRESFCLDVCPMGLAPYREADNLLCVNCGRCIDACRSERLVFRGFELKPFAQKKGSPL